MRFSPRCDCLRSRQHKMPLDSAEHDQIALPTMAWHTTALECSSAHERVARDYASTRYQSNAPPSTRYRERDGVPSKCRPTRCASAAPHHRSAQRSSQVCVPKSPRSCGRVAASDCMRLLGAPSKPTHHPHHPVTPNIVSSLAREVVPTHPHAVQCW
jgi:hypothetical protein